MTTGNANGQEATSQLQNELVIKTATSIPQKTVNNSHATDTIKAASAFAVI